MQFSTKKINDMPNGGNYIPLKDDKDNNLVQEVEKVPEPNVDSVGTEIAKENIENKMEETNSNIEVEKIENEVVPETKLEEIEYTTEDKIIEPVVEEIKKVEKDVSKWFGQSVFENKRERFGLIFIIIGILFVSIVSVSHLISYFGVGNTPVESVLAAIAFEILSLGSIAAFVLLPRIKSWALWVSLFFLYALQLMANMFSSYDLIDASKELHFFQFFGLTFSEIAGKRIAAILLSGILPTTTFVFTQLIKPYFTKKNKI